uniref:FHA domain-containing protein n=1 Tax=Oncorhynchus tshawytscha TaxID=74940 RepID=A0AAZ3SPM1_ONCTS
MEKKHGRSQPWGKLVKVDSQSEVLLVNRECTVGRRKGCDLSFPANKLVSGDHCKIVQDKSSGLVWLEDTRPCLHVSVHKTREDILTRHNWWCHQMLSNAAESPDLPCYSSSMCVCGAIPCWTSTGAAGLG